MELLGYHVTRKEGIHGVTRLPGYKEYIELLGY